VFEQDRLLQCDGSMKSLRKPKLGKVSKYLIISGLKFHL
jgi:hypothetical protein